MFGVEMLPLCLKHYTKWLFSETSGQVHPPQKQPLIYGRIWTAIDRSDFYMTDNLSEKITFYFIKAVVISILLYGCMTQLLW